MTLYFCLHDVNAERRPLCLGDGALCYFAEMDVRLGLHDAVRPDLVGYRRERPPNPSELRPIELAPDWVCEVLSPSTAARDRTTKLALYPKYGVSYYWLIDPEVRVLEALALREGAWLELGAYDETASVRIAPFEAIELPVGRLFLPRPPEDGPAKDT